jgi:hypothetical protein
MGTHGKPGTEAVDGGGDPLEGLLRAVNAAESGESSWRRIARLRAEETEEAHIPLPLPKRCENINP